MWRLAIIVILSISAPRNVHAQEPQKIRAAMSQSIEKQLASIEQQRASILSPVRPPVQPASGLTSFAAPAPAAYACAPVAASDLAMMIDNVAREHSIDAALVREVARQESGFRPCAVSPKGAAGVMQLMPATQAQFEVHDPFDAHESLSAGAKLLKQLLDRYHGDLALALSAYNAGMRRVDRTFSVPEIPETKNYVTDILGRLGK